MTNKATLSPNQVACIFGVSFKPEALSKWAKKHQINIVVDPLSLLAEPETKPGPKPRAAVEEKAPVKAKVTKTGKSFPALRKEKQRAEAT